MMNFASSFKPIFVWLTILLGVDLDLSAKRSTVARYSLIVYSLFRLIITDFTLLTYYVATTPVAAILSQNNLATTRTGAVNFKINIMTAMVSCFIIHFSFIVSARFKWKKLWQRLEQIERIVGDELALYRRLRKFSIALVSLLLLVIKFS